MSVFVTILVLDKYNIYSIHSPVKNLYWRWATDWFPSVTIEHYCRYCCTVCSLPLTGVAELVTGRSPRGSMMQKTYKPAYVSVSLVTFSKYTQHTTVIQFWIYNAKTNTGWVVESCTASTCTRIYCICLYHGRFRSQRISNGRRWGLYMVSSKS